MKIQEHWGKLVLLIALWLATGLLPVLLGPSIDKSGQFGDSWGMATSLFSCFGFLLATYTLLMQQRESHEMGEIQRKQMQLTETTAAIQQQTLRNSMTQTYVECLTKIYKDVANMKQCALEWRIAMLRPREHPKAPDDAEESRQYNLMKAELDADCMVLQLTLGESSKELVEAINSYCDGIFVGIQQEDTLKRARGWEAYVDNLAFAVKDAIKPVWKELLAVIDDVAKS